MQQHPVRRHFRDGDSHQHVADKHNAFSEGRLGPNHHNDDDGQAEEGKEKNAGAAGEGRGGRRGGGEGGGGLKGSSGIRQQSATQNVSRQFNTPRPRASYHALKAGVSSSQQQQQQQQRAQFKRTPKFTLPPSSSSAYLPSSSAGGGRGADDILTSDDVDANLAAEIETATPQARVDAPLSLLPPVQSPSPFWRAERDRSPKRRKILHGTVGCGRFFGLAPAPAPSSSISNDNNSLPYLLSDGIESVSGDGVAGADGNDNDIASRMGGVDIMDIVSEGEDREEEEAHHIGDQDAANDDGDNDDVDVEGDGGDYGDDYDSDITMTSPGLRALALAKRTRTDTIISDLSEHDDEEARYDRDGDNNDNDDNTKDDNDDAIESIATCSSPIAGPRDLLEATLRPEEVSTPTRSRSSHPHRLPFVFRSAFDQAPPGVALHHPPPPPPPVFSPHRTRRSAAGAAAAHQPQSSSSSSYYQERFVPGGLAMQVRNWIIQSPLLSSSMSARGSKDYWGSVASTPASRTATATAATSSLSSPATFALVIEQVVSTLPPQADDYRYNRHSLRQMLPPQFMSSSPITLIHGTRMATNMPPPSAAAEPIHTPSTPAPAPSQQAGSGTEQQQSQAVNVLLIGRDSGGGPGRKMRSRAYESANEKGNYLRADVGGCVTSTHNAQHVDVADPGASNYTNAASAPPLQREPPTATARTSAMREGSAWVPAANRAEQGLQLWRQPPQKGDILSIRRPTWDIHVMGGVWTVALNWAIR